MRLSELMAAAGLRPRKMCGDAEVRDVQVDSRRCGSGSCFVAVRGAAEDGHKYVPAALKAGAVAVVCQDDSSVPESLPHAVMEDSREAPGLLAQAALGWPSRKLINIAVTGTKGKSTTTYLVRSILEEAGSLAGLLGTIAYQTGRRTLAAPTTTPDPVGLAEMTAEMVADGCTHLVMEVSSHALVQHRTAGVEFRVAVFTNLSGDHMDFHGDMASYLAAKRTLFEHLDAGATAVLNRDDPAGPAMAEATRAKVLWYSLQSPADLRGAVRRIDYSGTDFTVDFAGRETPFRTPLMGRHNAYNCLAAAGVAAALGIDLAVAARAVARLDRVPGRLEPVDAEAPFKVFVDYAHTDGALENVLRALRDVEKAGRVIVVFGCGGDRDRTKRPRMAAVAERLADVVVVTSDNPRGEDPAAIVAEVLTGFSPAARARAIVEVDRRLAIDAAIAQAAPGDVVLIAGKGHESYQILGSRRIHFDDLEVAAEAMRNRERGNPNAT